MEELHSTPAYLAAVLGIVPEAIIGFDREGRIILFNPAARKMFRMRGPEAHGRRIWCLLSEQSCAELKAIIPQCRAARRRQTTLITREFAARRKSGAIFPCEFRLVGLSLGGELQFVAFLRDLSGNKASERRANKLQADLMHLSRLVHMGDMASALAHELNQPLSAVGAYLGAGMHSLSARTDEESVNAIEAMERAAVQVVRAADVIRRLRDFVVRGESEKRVESLARMVEEALELGTVAEKGRRLDVAIELNPDVDLVVANRIQIQQVLLNLIRNGLEAMREMPSRRLVISSERAGGDMVRVSVADRGTGISPKVGAKIFQSFVTTKTHGLGVGLSISRTIIEAHGGRIAAKPNPGGGSIFHFTLRSGSLSDAARAES